MLNALSPTTASFYAFKNQRVGFYSSQQDLQQQNNKQKVSDNNKLVIYSGLLALALLFLFKKPCALSQASSSFKAVNQSFDEVKNTVGQEKLTSHPLKDIIMEEESVKDPSCGRKVFRVTWNVVSFIPGKVFDVCRKIIGK